MQTKKLKKQYAAFSEFVRDVAQICHNAQVYNRPSSQLFQDAGRLRELFRAELQKLVEDGTITAEDTVLPDLGPLPEAEDSPVPEDGEGEEEEEGDEDDEDDESDDDRRRSASRRRGGRKLDRDDEAYKRRARPPKVYTPHEGRIHAVLRGLRSLKHLNGDPLAQPFEKLPDKQATPDYYAAIKNPIALDTIKRRARRKKYQNVDEALEDIELMFENAKQYNEDESQIYKDAVELQKQARVFVEQEKRKPDSDFEGEEGRRHVPEIAYKGEVWRVGKLRWRFRCIEVSRANHGRR